MSDTKPIRGLPSDLPRGEVLLWQGQPDLRGTALRIFHLRKVAIYFTILAAWRFAFLLSTGSPPMAAASGACLLLGLGLLVGAILFTIAWLVRRTTVYTITSRRVVMKIGVALPIYFNLPFTVLESASVRLHADGTGSIPLVLNGGNRLAYPVLWPHARPWRLSKPEPALRVVPDAARVAHMLAQAVAAASPGRIQVAQPALVPARDGDPAAWPLAPAAV